MNLESKSLWMILGLSLVLKLCLNAFIPLAPDEAYYWTWSFYPALSYLDHPGMVGWLFYLGNFFNFIPYGVRIPNILLGHLTLLVWIIIVRKLWSPELTWRFLLLYLAIPFLGLGSILVTPDVPVLFFWSLSFLFLLYWLKNPSLLISLLLGLCLGLGFCSKYHMVLFVLSFGIFVWREKPTLTRQHLLSFVPIFLLGLIASMPVLIWNFQNDWASFRFQINHGLGRSEWRPHWTGDYLAGQFLLFSPVLWFLYLKGARYRSLRLFFWMSLVPWVFFFLSSFRGAVQANWPIVSLAPALILATGAHQSWRLLKIVIGIYLAAAGVVLSLWIYPWAKDAPDKLTEVHQIREAMTKVLPYQPLYGGSYQIASVLWYYSGKPVFKVREMSRVDEFDRRAGSTPNESHFFVMREKNEPLPVWLTKLNAKSLIIMDLGRYELVRVDR